MADETFGDVFSAAVAADGRSLQEIGLDLGVTQPQISKWLSGQDVPTERRVERLAKFVGVSEERMILMLHRWRSMSRSERMVIGTLQMPVSPTTLAVYWNAVVNERNRLVHQPDADPQQFLDLTLSLATIERVVARLSPELQADLRARVERLQAAAGTDSDDLALAAAGGKGQLEEDAVAELERIVNETLDE